MASREWGITVEAPVWNRSLASIDDDGNPVAAQHTSLGDVRLLGMYTGLSDDMSLALLFGAKLPTGAINQTVFDRDTQIGTGTTDVLLGGYEMGQNPSWGWFAQVLLQHALNTREGYRPGDSFDVNVGFHYDGIVRSSSLVPMLQVIGSFRGSDSGVNSDPGNTGYQRLLIAPGVEFQINARVQLFADIRIPVVTNVTGYQLVAPSLLNATSSISL